MKKQVPKRLQHHFEPRRGWMNDPNGLIFFRGQYHVFFQHNPHAPVWGPMHWGHAVSDDLLHWRELPIALTPDQWYENDGGCWSGSAVVHNDRLYLFYTGVSKELGQTQCMAFSDDGLHFHKHEHNPIIRHAPNGSTDFRDPKITKISNTYYMVVGAGRDGVGSVLLYRSEDLLAWNYAGVLLQGAQYGTAIECPDFFPLGGGFALMFSQMNQPLRSTVLIYGDFDGEIFTPKIEQRPVIGPHFYAPQSFLDPKGRRIVIGWLYSWDKQLDEGADYAGALTIPMELSWDDERFMLYPVEEAQHLLQPTDPLVKSDPDFVELAVGFELPLCWQGGVRRLEVLRDTKTVEVFVNGGEVIFSYWVGSGLQT